MIRVYWGTILTDEGKEKKVNIDFEPFRAINTSLYLCDNKFHTEALAEVRCFYNMLDWAEVSLLRSRPKPRTSNNQSQRLSNTPHETKRKETNQHPTH